jgi:hypothetical protein
MVRAFTIAVLFFIILQSCHRSSVKPDAPEPLPDSVLNAYYSGSWQAQVDGVNYSGTIDTSYTLYASSIISGHPDTLFSCTGTSSDKRANVHFQFLINRSPANSTATLNTSFGDEAQMAFDNNSDTVLESFNNSQSAVVFTIDSTTPTHIQAHFSGTLGFWGPTGLDPHHTITNGKIVAGWHNGDHDANSFSFESAMQPLDGSSGTEAVTGYINSAQLVSNTLVLEGTPSSMALLDRFRLSIRTGGTVKSGVYHSEDGDVGFSLYYQGGDLLYVDDSTGSMSVTITQITGNTVYGNFSGTNQGGGGQFPGTPLSAGSFAARIKNYVPEPDSANQWAFGAYFDSYTLKSYYLFGGNVTNAVLAETGGRYSLSVNGTTDHGASTFQFLVSSPNPIQKGAYTLQSGPNTLDVLTFSSIEKTYYGVPIVVMPILNPDPAEVIIDSIGAHYVQGEIKGRMAQDFGTGSTINPSLFQQGRFSATF